MIESDINTSNIIKKKSGGLPFHEYRKLQKLNKIQLQSNTIQLETKGNEFNNTKSKSIEDVKLEIFGLSKEDIAKNDEIIPNKRNRERNKSKKGIEITISNTKQKEEAIDLESFERCIDLHNVETQVSNIKKDNKS